MFFETKLIVHSKCLEYGIEASALLTSTTEQGINTEKE